MNDLRLILLGIGLLIIAVIYLWGTFKQKSQDRSHMRKITSFKRESFKDIKVLPTYDDEVSAETLAELGEFLSNPKLPDINTSNFSLRSKAVDINQQKTGMSKSISDKSLDSSAQEKHSPGMEKDKSSKAVPDDQIIIFLIKAPPGKVFSGVDILSATEAVGLEFGDMNIFHYYGMEGLVNDHAIFSLASMYEPGYFELEEMETFQTRGLALFMQLPTPINGLTAFDLMQETAMGLAGLLEGEICSSKHEPIDEKTLRSMREMVAGII